MDSDSSRPSESLDVESLTRRLTRGDEAAYRVFYEAYFDRLSRYLLIVTAGDDDAVREALQGTLVRLVRYCRVFSDEAVFWSWLTVLARSALSDDNRKRRRYLAFLDRFTIQSRIEHAPGSDAVSGDRLGELLKLKLSTLEPHERSLIEQKYFEHMSVKSIAEKMNMTEGAVESSLVRTRRKLKQSVLSELKNEPPS